MQRISLAILLLPILILLASCSWPGRGDPVINLDFENISQGQAAGWVKYGGGDHIMEVDSSIVHEGKYSVNIQYTGGKSTFRAWALNIPAIYEGKKIKLSGYIRTENVHEGYAGLWMRIDPSVAFDNMNDRGIRGTTDWTQYEIELDLKPSADNIVVGGILVGKGKMWLDNLELSIDGKPLEEVGLKDEALADDEFEEWSGIILPDAGDETLEELYRLGLIWGFLKYHHPVISSGELNWDYELFRILPDVLESDNRREGEDLLADWISELGEIESGISTYPDSGKVKIYPDLNWITQSGFSPGLVLELEKVKNAKRDGENHYVSFVENVGNPIFNEDPYAGLKPPDVGYRILSLYRYWNIIQYYFPYKNLIEEDWKGVLAEFIPKFIAAQGELEYHLVCLEIIARVHDTHANLWAPQHLLNEYRGIYYCPLKISFIEDRAVVVDYFNTELGEESGLMPGDVIEEIEGEAVADIVSGQLKYTPASNYPTQLRDLARNLLRTNENEIEVKYRREGKVVRKKIRAYPAEKMDLYKSYQARDTCFSMLDHNIAYIHHGSLKRSYLPGLWEEIRSTKGLIIDIRNYPSDFPLYKLSAYLLPRPIPFFKASSADSIYPGLFTFGDAINAGKTNKDPYKGKVVIIVNELTQSSAEFHSMAYRTHPHAVVIGSTTAAADGNVSHIMLPGNIKTMISGIGIYYPDGRETQRIGIVPDIEVHPTLESIKSGSDLVLEEAIHLILE